MDASKKRKRDAELPRITYHTQIRTFDRLFRESSLSGLQDVVRRKLSLEPSSCIHLAQLRDGKLIDLEDEDDFDAFQSIAQTNFHVDVKVLVNTNTSDNLNASPHSPAVAISPPDFLASLDQLARHKHTSIPTITLPHSGDVGGPQPLKKKRRRVKDPERKGELHPEQRDTLNSPTPAGIQATSSGLATSTEKNSFRRAGQVPIDQEIQKSQAKKEETTKPRGRSPSEGLVDKTPKRKRSKSRGPSGGGLLSNLKAFAINQPENEQSSSEFVEQATESLATTTESDAMLTTKISKKIFKRKKVDRAIHGHDRETEGSSAKIMDEGENNSVSEEVTNTQKNIKGRRHTNPTPTLESNLRLNLAADAVRATMVKLLAEKKAMLAPSLSLSVAAAAPIVASLSPSHSRSVSVPLCDQRTEGSSGENIPIVSDKSNATIPLSSSASSSPSLLTFAAPPTCSKEPPISDNDLDDIIRGPSTSRIYLADIDMSDSEEKLSPLEEDERQNRDKRRKWKWEPTELDSSDEGDSDFVSGSDEGSDTPQMHHPEHVANPSLAVPRVELKRRRGDVDMEIEKEQNPSTSGTKESTTTTVILKTQIPLEPQTEKDQPFTLIALPSNVEAEFDPTVAGSLSAGDNFLEPTAIPEHILPHQRTRSGGSTASNSTIEPPGNVLAVIGKIPKSAMRKLTNLASPPLPKPSPITRSKKRLASSKIVASPPMVFEERKLAPINGTASDKLPHAAWPVSSNSSPNSSAIMLSESRSNPLPTPQPKRVGGNPQKHSRNALFIPSDTQKPFPYSQYSQSKEEIDTDEDEDDVPIPASTRLQAPYPKLSELTDQRAIFPPPTLRSAARITTYRRTPVNELYGRGINEENGIGLDSSGSSDSDIDNQSHIPKSRRAGLPR